MTIKIEEVDETEVDETEQHRYLFLVRQQFQKEPVIDCFYELSVPSGLTSEQAQIMTKLDERFCKQQISDDTHALQGMQLRLRFNSDMYPRVCLVRTATEITGDTLNTILLDRHRRGTLMEFLDDAAMRP